MKFKSIMVVDDNDADQFLCKIAIEDFDPEVKVIQAYDGQEALEFLDSAEMVPDILFLDINMPRMNGHEFLEAYDKTSKGKAPVIIMLTSSSQDNDKQKALSYNYVKGYLLKPLAMENLSDISERF